MSSLARWLPWIKAVVFLFVLLGLGHACVDSYERWQAETAQLRLEAIELRQQAAEKVRAAQNSTTVDQSVLDSAAKQIAEADHRESAVPSIANLGWWWLLAAASFYAAGLMPPGWILHRTLIFSGLACQRRRALAAQLLGHAGKYIPGKAMVILLRVSAVLPKSEPAKVILATTAVFFETLLMMSVGAVLSGALLWNTDLPPWVRGLAILMAVAAMLPTFPPIMSKIIAKVQTKRESQLHLQDKASGGEYARPSGTQSVNDPQDVSDTHRRLKITWALLAQSWVMSLVSWLLIGLSFACLIVAIPTHLALPSLMNLAVTATAAISLGMVLGFASLLPGGAGVREYVTLLVMTPAIGPTHALLAVIAARLMFILTESFLAGLSYFYLKRMRPSAATSASTT